MDPTTEEVDRFFFKGLGLCIPSMIKLPATSKEFVLFIPKGPETMDPLAMECLLIPNNADEFLPNICIEGFLLSILSTFRTPITSSSRK
jgi:hypothetical protein